ncbi:MAG: PEP-CTERM-box response regulator transcription factor [Proteobacteria bacterium]|nr:PEP-CTERM-box response regulator transcription factor [Pseudomonadota bacterium]
MNHNTPKLLIVEDDAGLQKQLRWCFDGMEVLQASHRTEALALLRRHEPQVVLQDLGLPPDAEGVSEGFATLQQMLALAPQTKVIVMTGNADKDNPVRAVGLGAWDFFPKPVETDALKLIVGRAFHVAELERQNRSLRQAHGPMPLEGIIATDPQMLKVCRMVEKVATTNASVLVLGESGTGKELIARALHTHSDRAANRFVAINCAAIPEQLLESELFGYEKGAFTGAAKTTPGKIEMAEGGTLFLDEIGDMPLSLQSKLLRFLQARVIDRVGGRHEIPVDVRVVCATHQDLPALIEAKQFRQDLYYRISEVSLTLPPLRSRPSDAVVLARAILHRAAQELPRAPKSFTDDALKAIQSHPWPGNVRELENKVRSAAIMASGAQLTADDLGLASGAESVAVLNLKTVRTRAERQAVEQALAMTGGNVSHSAELLGVTRPTLYDLLEKLQIRPENAS